MQKQQNRQRSQLRRMRKRSRNKNAASWVSAIVRVRRSLLRGTRIRMQRQAVYECHAGETFSRPSSSSGQSFFFWQVLVHFVCIFLHITTSRSHMPRCGFLAYLASVYLEQTVFLELHALASHQHARSTATVSTVLIEQAHGNRLKEWQLPAEFGRLHLRM